uniref:Uncharacterized protein n=1 Tax=Noccaea caerulescens TaxID=107243 RepID=A0A1J3JBH8_NOCCA
MQNVMNTYNASLTAPPPPPVAAPTSQPKNSTVFSSGTTPNVMSATLLGNKRVDFRSFSTPLTGHQTITGKRKAPENSAGAAPVTRKAARTTKTQGNSTANESNKKIPQAANNVSSQTPSGTLTLAKNNSSANELVMTGHGSSVAKCLFNKADSSIPASSTCLRTPQKHTSPGSDKCNSPQKEATPTNCTIVTKERFTISPLKEITSYTVERSRLISSSSSPLKSSSKRDHVKGKLNFDDTDATEMSLQAPAAGNLASSSPSVSDPEVDLSDIDFSILGEDFSFSELLVDFDLGCEGSTQ